MVKRVIATERAVALIERLKRKHGPLMFHQSGGCCEGSSPMCYRKGELLTGNGDRLLGEIGESPFYMNNEQFEYWKHTQLIIDVAEGRSGFFSLEASEGKRFVTKSRIFSNEERKILGI